MYLEDFNMNFDFIETVFTRPQMYTLFGTYLEVVSFLEGYYSGLSKDRRATQHVEIWSSFRKWLSIKLGNPKTSELKALYEQFGDKSLEIFTSFYHEFKGEWFAGKIKDILFDNSKSFDDLHFYAKNVLNNELPRHELIKTIEAIRSEEIDERSDDLLLELLDSLSGWCSPHQKL